MAYVADIFRRFGRGYINTFGADMLPSHLKTISDIMDCRTQALGGYAQKCNNKQCGHIVYHYCSCDNRHCPQCFKRRTDAWIEAQKALLLPVTYFHIVFTLPAELRRIVRSHQKILYDVLFKAASLSLMELAADPNYVGGKIGLICVLHTWSRVMAYHPHLHCLVPAGGISKDGCQWLPSNPRFLVPRDALCTLFRGKFMAMAKKALPDVDFPESVWDKKWGVDLRAVDQHPENVIEYLGRYIHRVAISNNRIESINDNSVTIRSQNSKTREWKSTPFQPHEFIRRFLQHVLPKRFAKIRYYGFMSPTNRTLLQRMRYLFFAVGQLLLNQFPERLPATVESVYTKTPPKVLRCPKCRGYLSPEVWINPIYHGLPP
jgi:hypothetical protein